MGKHEKLDSVNIHRRKFLVTSVSLGAGLSLGVYLPGCSKQESDAIQALP